MTPDTETDKFSRLTPNQKQALKKLGIRSARDILYHFPSRYVATADVKAVRDIKEGEEATLVGRLESLKTKKSWRGRVPMAEGTLDDGTGKIKIVWFNQPYIAKMFGSGQPVKLSGKITQKSGRLSMANPSVEENIAVDTALFGDNNENPFLPVYPESRGITSNWFWHSAKKLLTAEVLDALPDPIPPEILKKYSLPDLKTALPWIHTPKRASHHAAARKRFAFEEIFFIQLERQKNRLAFEKMPAYNISANKKDIDSFTAKFPFKLTGAQNRAIETILGDMGSGKPMSRLLEGDVGSGKTAVAAAVAEAVMKARNMKSKLQVAYMAPTEILAKQHFASFTELFRGRGIDVGLITGSGAYKFPSKVNPKEATKISRAQLLKWASTGDIPILFGTHALVQEKVIFKDLALIVIDEQHRFGVNQRAKLARKGAVPHLLSMTATPIPRTLALTIYGDLDLSLLDELPAGRKPVITEIVTPTKRERAYEKIREELKAGRQAYIICPRIDEPDPEKEMALIAKSVKAEAGRLEKEVFPETTLGILHSKMKPDEKEFIMGEFARGAIQILVATSVVEVGVNVPNATTIIIEGAERFGLAQLHQLRGRVLRSIHQAHCFLFSETKSAKSLERLKALVSAKNGFELAELDLSIRGAGELSGAKQWGISDLGMEAIKNIKMVEAAREEARGLLKDDPELLGHPLLQKELSSRGKEIHFE